MTTRSHVDSFTFPRAEKRGRVFPSLTSLLAVARQRRALAHLDDRALNDIGVSRSEAEREAGRPAWDVPTHWQY